jgi:hypothetical protein
MLNKVREEDAEDHHPNRVAPRSPVEFPRRLASQPSPPRRASPLPTYDFFNRQYQILEPLVSYRKQSIGTFLIAKFRPILRSENMPPARAACPPLATSHSSPSSLIGNEMHSREESSASKQSTYKILIGNEFHCSAAHFSAQNRLRASPLPCLFAPWPLVPGNSPLAAGGRADYASRCIATLHRGIK